MADVLVRPSAQLIDDAPDGAGEWFLEVWQYLQNQRKNRTAWRIWYSDGDGVMQELPMGTSGQVLTSNGESAAPSWETP
jgi:hypothetical protein